jgi:hypothetical protein
MQERDRHIHIRNHHVTDEQGGGIQATLLTTLVSGACSAVCMFHFIHRPIVLGFALENISHCVTRHVGNQVTLLAWWGDASKIPLAWGGPGVTKQLQRWVVCGATTLRCPYVDLLN